MSVELAVRGFCASEEFLLGRRFGRFPAGRDAEEGRVARRRGGLVGLVRSWPAIAFAKGRQNGSPVLTPGSAASNSSETVPGRGDPPEALEVTVDDPGVSSLPKPTIGRLTGA